MNNQAIIAAANAAILVDTSDENRKKRKGAEVHRLLHMIFIRMICWTSWSRTIFSSNKKHNRWSTRTVWWYCSRSLTWQSLHNQLPRGMTRNQHRHPQDENGNLTRGDPRKFSLWLFYWICWKRQQRRCWTVQINKQRWVLFKKWVSGHHHHWTNLFTRSSENSEHLLQTEPGNLTLS